jgi:PAS domain-containing protein
MGLGVFKLRLDRGGDAGTRCIPSATGVNTISRHVGPTIARPGQSRWTKARVGQSQAMTGHTNPKSASSAAANHSALAETESRSAWVRVRPVIVLLIGITLSIYGFRATREWQLRRHGEPLGQRTSHAGAPYVILLGGCVMTLLSAACCRASAFRLRKGIAPVESQVETQPEQGLRPSAEVLLQILNGTSIPIFVINRQHAVTHWNQACKNLTGVEPRDIVGTCNAWTAFYPVKRPVMAELVVDQRPREEIVAIYGKECRESLALPGAYEFEALFPNLGNTSKWLFFTAAPLRDTTGQVVGAIETFQDMTERKRVEGELQRRITELSEAKRRLEVLVSNTTDREKRMVDLKREVNGLLQALGQNPKYTAPRQVMQIGANAPLPTVE